MELERELELDRELEQEQERERELSQKMKLSEFKARVKELAGERYHSVRVSIAEHPDGAIIYGWSVYIDGGNVIDARTPDEIFMALQSFSCGEAPEDEELPK